MNYRSGWWMVTCSSMLLGCSTFFGDAEAPESPRLVVRATADGEYLRGRQLHQMGNHAEAQQAYQAALAIDPSHLEARNGMAALVAASGDLDRAIGMLVELGASRPASHVFANLGHAYRLKGRLPEARAALQRALDLDPMNENAQRQLEALDKIAPPPGEPATALAAGLVSMPASPAETSRTHGHGSAARIEALSPGLYALRYPTGPQIVPMPSVEVLPIGATAPAGSPVPAAAVGAAPPQAGSGVASPARREADLRAGLPVELVNGNGVNGLARGLRGLLSGAEWQVVRTTNHEQFTVRTTRIEYVSSYVPAAQRLASTLGVQPHLKLNNLQAGTRLRVVLGHDCKDLDALRERLARAPDS